jgi:glutamate carboxypeptidase
MNEIIENTSLQLKSVIEENLSKAEELLETVVNINSFSNNKSGTDRVGSVFRKYFEELGLDTEVIPRSEVGNILLLSNKAYQNAGRGGFLFLSHMDTVFPDDENAIPFRIGDGGYRGNGVADDKGGGVITWQTLNALKKLGYLDRIPVRVLLNTDEETGSYHSRDFIEQESAKADLVLVVEFGRPRDQGATAVIGRLGRGVINVTLYDEKAETIMLDIIEESYYMAMPEDRRSLRIRTYKKEDNTCSVSMGFGFPDKDEGEYLLEMFKKMVTRKMKAKNIQGSVTGEIVRPALNYTKRHWEVYDMMCDIGHAVGFKIYSDYRVTCSDGSFVPPNIPVLDGIGPIGDYLHTEEEFMTPESLIIRPVILASLMVQMFEMGKINR